MESQLEFIRSLWTALEHSTKGAGVLLKLMGGLVKHSKTNCFSYVLTIWRFLERPQRSGEEILEESLAVLRGPWGVSGGPWEVIGALRVCSGQRTPFWDPVPRRRGPCTPSLGARSSPPRAVPPRWEPGPSPQESSELSRHPLGVHGKFLEILGEVNGRSQGGCEAHWGIYENIAKPLFFYCVEHLEILG